MSVVPANPFNLTKANDFSDQQIQEFWVDMPGGGGLLGLLKPTSPMPMLVLGGKGSGKTHLMRYCSFELQKLRRDGHSLFHSIEREGFLGIYSRCEGLNANRFALKGQPQEVWNDLFQYYMELFLCELLVRHLAELLEDHASFKTSESDFVHDVFGLFDASDFESTTTLSGLIDVLKKLRSQVDLEVNNCALLRTLNVRIRASRSRLIFGVPILVRKYVPEFSKTVFLYLIDELENFSIDQQKYVFTLIRERKDPTSFKVGARLYGIKTYLTFSGDEEIKEGAEYEQLPLDEMLREDSSRYNKFAKLLISSRIANLVLGRREAIESVLADLDGMFERHPNDKFAREETKYVLQKYEGRERPYFVKFRNELERLNLQGTSVDSIIESLRYPELPLLEKMNLFLMYRAWASGKDLAEESRQIKQNCQAFALGELKSGSYADVFSHFSSDLLAQLFRDTDHDQEYLGIDDFIHMSMGLPRNLLICLKHIYHWAVFNGDKPFQTGIISIDAQQKGVRQAADWFFRDASTKGEDGRFLQEAITRLGELFRVVRFSQKPVECSLCSFSTDSTKLSDRGRTFLILAEKYSLLIGFGEGQKDKNSMRVDAKFQLNSMLSPRWDLPIFRRGVLALDPGLVSSIFDPGKAVEFADLLSERTVGMSPPFSQRRRAQKTNGEDGKTDHPQLEF